MATALQTWSSVNKKAEAHLSPIVFLKSATIDGEFPLPSKIIRGTPKDRHRSKQPIINSRGHVTTAKFYDWSRCHTSNLSSSKLHKDVPGSPLSSQNKNPRANTFLANTGEINLPPELSIQKNITHQEIMFARDKKTLTKGEREIIEGIYKNRGDVTAADALGKSEFQVNCHKDAWYAGKSTRRNMATGKTFMKGAKIEGHLVKSYSRLEMDKSSTSTDISERGDKDTLSCMLQDLTVSLHSNNKDQRVMVQSSSKCVFCQANKEELYNAKRQMVSPDQDCCWVGDLLAARGKTDRSNLYDLIQRHTFIDNNNGLRTPLSFGPTSQTGINPGHCTNSEFINECMKHRPDFYHNFKSKSCFKCFPILLNWVLNDLSVVSVQSASIGSGRAKSVRQKKHGIQIQPKMQQTKCVPANKTGYDVCYENYIDTNDQQEENSDESDLNKRLKVIVHVPTVEFDLTDDLTPVDRSSEHGPPTVNNNLTFQTEVA